MLRTHYKTSTLWQLNSLFCLHLQESFWIKDRSLRNTCVHLYCRPISVQTRFNTDGQVGLQHVYGGSNLTFIQQNCLGQIQYLEEEKSLFFCMKMLIYIQISKSLPRQKHHTPSTVLSTRKTGQSNRNDRKVMRQPPPLFFQYHCTHGKKISSTHNTERHQEKYVHQVISRKMVLS